MGRLFLLFNAFMISACGLADKPLVTNESVVNAIISKKYTLLKTLTGLPWTGRSVPITHYYLRIQYEPYSNNIEVSENFFRTAIQETIIKVRLIERIYKNGRKTGDLIMLENH